MPTGTTRAISAAGSTDLIWLKSPSKKTPSLAPHPIGIIVHLTPGASLSYTVEVTGDDVIARGYVAANGLWTAIAALSNLTASSTAFMTGLVVAIRLTVGSYSSGTASLQVVEND